jgi:acetyl/propionyl-CoA carboxylase alpha subunit
MNNFLPDIGTLKTYKLPQGYGVRVDDSYQEGMEIPIHYDPMIAKLITFGKTREEARLRMLRAINDYHVSGVETTLSFGKFALQHEAYIKGDFDTKFIDKYFTPDKLNFESVNADLEIKIAAISGMLFGKEEQHASGTLNNSNESAWKRNRKSLG